MKKVSFEKLIRDKVNNKKAVFGYNMTLKKLKSNELESVIFASNCEEYRRKELLNLCKLNETEVIESKLDNVQLGILSKRQHNVSVLGLLK